MTNFTRIPALALVALLTFSQVACSADQVTATLGALVNAAATYEDTVSPQNKPIVDAVVLNCVDPALNILADSTQTGLQKSEAIGLACTPALASLTNNTQLSALALALTTFLDSVKTLSAQVQSTTAGRESFRQDPKAAKVNKKELRKLRKQVDAIKAKLAARK